MKQQQTRDMVYQSAEQSFGIIPPLIKEIAEVSVPVAALYVDGVTTMNASAFSEIEINAIELRISSLNGCESCIRGHSYLSRKAGLSEADVKAITEGRLTSIDSLNRIIRGTDAIFYASRSGYAGHLNFWEKEQFSRKEIFEIIGLLSLKTISNNINNYLKAVMAPQTIPG